MSDQQVCQCGGHHFRPRPNSALWLCGNCGATYMWIRLRLLEEKGWTIDTMWPKKEEDGEIKVWWPTGGHIRLQR
jgi:hypothetical protein